MVRLVNAQPRAGYRVWLRYTDGAEGEVDLSDLAGRGVFRAWSDRRLFESLLVTDRGALEWPGGLDVCGDALYLRLTGEAPEEGLARLHANGVHA